MLCQKLLNKTMKSVKIAFEMLLTVYRETAFIFYSRTDVLVKVSKYLRQKMSRPEGNSKPSDSCIYTQCVISQMNSNKGIYMVIQIHDGRYNYNMKVSTRLHDWDRHPLFHNLMWHLHPLHSPDSTSLIKRPGLYTSHQTLAMASENIQRKGSMVITWIHHFNLIIDFFVVIASTNAHVSTVI